MDLDLSHDDVHRVIRSQIWLVLKPYCRTYTTWGPALREQIDAGRDRDAAACMSLCWTAPHDFLRGVALGLVEREIRSSKNDPKRNADLNSSLGALATLDDMEMRHRTHKSVERGQQWLQWRARFEHMASSPQLDLVAATQLASTAELPSTQGRALGLALSIAEPEPEARRSRWLPF